MYPFKFVENNSYSKTETHEPVSGAESRAVSHSEPHMLYNVM